MDMTTLHLPPDAADGLGRLQAQWKSGGRRMLPLATIVVAHLVLFYLAQSGMLRKVAREALPEIMTVNFVAPPPPPPPSAPMPKTVDVTAAPQTIVPPLPLLPNTQVEPAISTPPPAPAAAEVVAPVTTPVPTAPTPIPVPATPHLVSGVEYINAPPPMYPAISRRMGESGVVLLRVLVNEQGMPAEVTVQKSSGSSNLDEAGRQTVLHKYLFKPYMEAGKAVSVFVLIPMNFRLS
jgi:protein TonB